MLSLSQTTGYAIRALGCLSDHPGEPFMARQISDCTGVPLPYLSKILNALVHAGLVTGKRGYKGGFALAHSTKGLSLRQVADAVEGPDWDSACLLGLEDCREGNPCPAHSFWSQVRTQVHAELERLTVADMAAWERHPRRGKLKSCCNPACAPEAAPARASRSKPSAMPARTVLKGRPRS
jgi:Rrf2 family protein